MYNVDLKNRFIIEKNKADRSITAIKRRFEVLGQLENEQQNDLASIPFEVIAKEIFNYTNILSYSSYYNYIILVKQYKGWCQDEGVFPKNEIIYVPDELKLKKFYKEYMKRQVYKNFDELHQSIDDIFKCNLEVEYMVKSEFMRLYLLMLYSGISEKDIFHCQLSDFWVNEDDVNIYIGDSNIRVHDRNFAELINKRKNAMVYRVERGRRFDEKDLNNYLIDFGADDPYKTHELLKKEWSRYVKIYNDANDEKRNIKPFNVYVCGIIRQKKENPRCYSINSSVEIINEVLTHIEHSHGPLSAGKRSVVREIYSALEEI